MDTHDRQKLDIIQKISQYNSVSFQELLLKVKEKLQIVEKGRTSQTEDLQLTKEESEVAEIVYQLFTFFSKHEFVLVLFRKMIKLDIIKDLYSTLQSLFGPYSDFSNERTSGIIAE